MTIRIVAPDKIPTLEQIQDVPTDDLLHVYNTCLHLQETCDLENGVGISAVQAGIPWKLFLVKFQDGSYGHFVNCSYIPSWNIGDGAEAGKFLHLEGCLSLRNARGKLRTFEVYRYKKILVTGFRLDVVAGSLALTSLIDYYVDGFYAAVFQHEIDHHRAVLISDIGKEVEIYAK